MGSNFNKSWIYVANGVVKNGSSTSNTFNLPAGANQNDLIVVCFAWRNTATITINTTAGDAGWNTVAAVATGNINTTPTNSIGSAAMYFKVRGTTDPNTTFTYSSSPNCWLVNTFCFRGVNTANAFADGNSYNQTATAVLANCGPVTTASNGSLIMFMVGGGSDTTASGWTNVTNPNTALWVELHDSLTTTGGDTTLAVASAVMWASGTTGVFRVTMAANSRHSTVVGAFNPQPQGRVSLT